MKKIIVASAILCFSLNISAGNSVYQKKPQDIDSISTKTVMVIDGISGDYISGGKTKLYTNLSARPEYGDISRGISFDMPGDITTITADFAAPNHKRIKKGIYNSATRFPFQNEDQPGMSISGDGRGCNTLTGKFIVRDVHYSEVGDLQDIAIDFIQHCEGLDFG